MKQTKTKKPYLQKSQLWTVGLMLLFLGIALLALTSSTGFTLKSSARETVNNTMGKSFSTINPKHQITRVINTDASDKTIRPLISPDPDLKPGFPVQTYERAGTYQGGPDVHAQIANIDADAGLEIIASAHALGPLYAWKSNGTLSPGWPLTGTIGAASYATGTYDSTSNAVPYIASGYFTSQNQAVVVAHNGAGTIVPTAWPRRNINYVSSSPSLSDVDNDGKDEIFVDEEDGSLHGYKADGSILPGWPVSGINGQKFNTPAIAEIDGNAANGPEILSATQSTSTGVLLYAFHKNGTIVSGFPVNVNPTGNGYPITIPVIGDVDGDGQLEIMVLAQNYPNSFQIREYRTNGTLKRTLTGNNNNLTYGTAIALADLNCDSIPDIILQADDGIYAWKGTGELLPGWPTSIGTGFWAGNSSPVVGDIDGDGQPDVIVTYHDAYYSGARDQVIAYNRTGQVLKQFPKFLRLGAGGVPAIADIDNDGRTDLIVQGNYWDGFTGNKDSVWAFDLHGNKYGRRLDWPQFGGGQRHTNYFPPIPPYASAECDRPWPTPPAR